MGMKGAIFVLAIGVAVVYFSRYNRGNDEPVSLNASYDYIICKISYRVINDAVLFFEYLNRYYRNQEVQ